MENFSLKMAGKEKKQPVTENQELVMLLLLPSSDFLFMVRCADCQLMKS